MSLLSLTSNSKELTKKDFPSQTLTEKVTSFPVIEFKNKDDSLYLAEKIKYVSIVGGLGQGMVASTFPFVNNGYFRMVMLPNGNLNK